MLTYVDDPHDGFGKVTKVPFRVPKLEGLYASDGTYSQLHEAIRIWSICSDEPLERTDASLHAVKPDKLFEYSALHRMLNWLWKNGFVEDEQVEKPIDRFAYSLFTKYKKYENETRSANTFRLVRRDGPDNSHAIFMDLYYHPVLFLVEHDEENRMDVHRVRRDTPVTGEDDSGEF